MSKRIKKMNWDDFTAAAKAGAAAAGAVMAVLGPEKHSPLTVLKKPVAETTRVIYNDVIPEAFKIGSDLVDKSGLEQMIRNKTVDLLYEELKQYSGKMLMQKLLGLIPTGNNTWVRMAVRFVQGILDGKDDRKELSEELSHEIVAKIMKLLDGSAVSLKFNDNIEKTIQTGVAGILETLMTTSASNSVMNMVLDRAKKLENFNVGGILEDTFGLDKQGMSDFIDATYSKYVGKDMLDSLEKEKKGDILADEILNIDNAELRDKIKNEHMDDIVDLVWRAANAGLSLHRIFHKKK